MKYEFDGISTDSYTEHDNEFTELTGEVIINNKPVIVELENKSVELYLYIEDTDTAEYEDSTDHIITIGVIPSFKSLSKENQQTLLNQYSKDDRSILDSIQLLTDIYYYGFTIPLKHETVKDLNLLDHTITSAKAIHTGITELIGFELDRYQNRIGNTGWDYLDNYCNDVDLIKTALNKFNN